MLICSTEQYWEQQHRQQHGVHLIISVPQDTAIVHDESNAVHPPLQPLCTFSQSVLDQSGHAATGARRGADSG